jgi:predicted CopG family antitoxin
MVFIHCFHKINQSILSKDISLRFDIEKRLQNWKEGLKNTLSLIASLFENIKRKQSQILSSIYSPSTASNVKTNIDEDRNSLIGV